MATLEEMNALREQLSKIQFPPDSLGVLAVCDHTGKIMFTALSAGEKHELIPAPEAHKLFNQMAVAVSHRVGEMFTHTGDVGELESELAAQNGMLQ